MKKDVLKLGIVGLDGHGPVFTQQVNGAAQAVKGLRVVAAMPFPSAMISKKQLAANVAIVRKLGVAIVTSPEELAARVVGILVLHDDGSKHLELARMFADKGKPLFIDKPFEASAANARAILSLCRKHKTKVFSASSLRFSREIRKVITDKKGGHILSAMTYAPYILRPTMPGWIYYAIHAVEPLYALLGPGCREVRCVNHAHGPVAVGTWQDGRLGVARAVKKGAHAYGFTVWKEKVTETAMVDSGRIYPELLKQIEVFFKTGKPPVPPEESVEVIAFMEAANKSMAAGGRVIKFKRKHHENRRVVLQF
ncbi:MAG: Gfo/Idh/MocA family oxidoreductase [Kiritimatiellia bacterium]|nr:Gfo/Idh/MocA family oxidoreductase [Kiritimatiellia bacterium]